MREFIAETGGRYTYSDDILNLQELALSMSAIFSECTPFIISGCEVEGATISSGYVWLGGKVRHFEGVQSTEFPYYIYERNSYETVVYANDVNKRGRSLYLCSGSTAIPTNIDPVTALAPAFLEVRADYAPRLLDKFFGRYALALNSPSQSQRVEKDVTFAGDVTIEKELKSKKALSVQNDAGVALKAKIKESGEISLGAYLTELLKAEIIINSNGSFAFVKGETELARIDESGFRCNSIAAAQIAVGKLQISQNNINNTTDNTDTGSIDINHTGYGGGVGKFRNFNIFDGKRCSIPILSVIGKTRTANLDGTFVCSSIILKNNTLSLWQNADSKTIAHFGFAANDTHDFALQNLIGNIVITPKGAVNIAGDLRLKGTDIYSIFTTAATYNNGMATKVDKIDGKQLSTEDFTSELKQKLEAIAGSNIEAGGTGFVTAADVAVALSKKLTSESNLQDLGDKGVARANLDIYSKSEGDTRYLRISENLEELVALTAEEINGMTQEEASALKAQRQQAVRDVILAEEKGIGATKVTLSQNLADLPDKVKARKNISVYSVAEIDAKLAGKLNADSAYVGATFTAEHKQKLEEIKTGHFAYIDAFGVSQAQSDGYILLTTLTRELQKYAPRMLHDYSSSEKTTIAANLNLYTKAEMDVRYVRVDQFLDDYIAKIKSEGKTTSDAQKLLRDKIAALSATDAAASYMRKDAKLTDLSVPNKDAQKVVCNHIGAAHKDDYQLKQTDTGWQQMSNYGAGTDTKSLFVRQIGNIVNIQGVINTARREGSHWGGIVAAIPNSIQPPPYGARMTYADFNDDHKYNRGTSLIISGGSRNMHLFESGQYGAQLHVNITYFV